jgi:hypothetical protein
VGGCWLFLWDIGYMMTVFILVAVIGNHCVLHDDENNSFCLGCFNRFGKIDDYSPNKLNLELECIIENIVSSRFKIS